MPSATPAVLLLDGLWNKTVAAARSLGKRGYRVSVGERTRFAPALFSRYCSRRFLHPSPETSPEQFLDALEKELRVGGYDVILAMEFGTQVLIARNRPRFEGMARFPFASADLAIRVQDKGELASFASTHGIECPATFRPEGPEDVHAMADRFPIPPSHQAQAFLRGPRDRAGGNSLATQKRVSEGARPPFVSDPPGVPAPGRRSVGGRRADELFFRTTRNVRLQAPAGIPRRRRSQHAPGERAGRAALPDDGAAPLGAPAGPALRWRSSRLTRGTAGRSFSR